MTVCVRSRSQRTDWRVERKLNSETFGVASARRGAFRGRGYYRGGMGGMYRGNYRGNYRGRGGQNRQNLHQPQASTSQPAGDAAGKYSPLIAQISCVSNRTMLCVKRHGVMTGCPLSLEFLDVAKFTSLITAQSI